MLAVKATGSGAVPLPGETESEAVSVGDTSTVACAAAEWFCASVTVSVAVYVPAVT